MTSEPHKFRRETGLINQLHSADAATGLNKIRVVLWLFSLQLVACASIPTVVERRLSADLLAARQDWQRTKLQSGMFELVAYLPDHIATNEKLTIYIEGDGLAWLSASKPSNDPTPLDPLALRLALMHPLPNAAYLARPCQFVSDPACRQSYWTEARFAPEVIESMNIGVSQLKSRFGAERLTLVGYSGGAAVAAILTARRNDVDQLVTVAGNLDHQAWTTHHRVTPLRGSLNANDAREQLISVPQIHFVGDRDKVIPPLLAYKWGEELRGRQNLNLHLVPGFDHQCCWVEDWKRLWKQVK